MREIAYTVRNEIDVEVLLSEIAGVVAGHVGAWPLMRMLRSAQAPDASPRLAEGLAAVFGAFVFLQFTILVVYFVWPRAMLPFGTCAALAFLAAAVGHAIRYIRYKG